MSATLGGTRPGAHPMVRLDGFMKNTDTMYQGSPGTQGSTFVRKMATYGRSRPSNFFIGESRATRPFLGKEAANDMSNLPAIFNDARADPRELSLEYPEPPEVDTSFIELYENHGLMLPSERFNEHLAMKDGERQLRADRAAIFASKKRHQMIERHHQHGVVGVDGPNHEGTKLYAGLRADNEVRRARSETHAAGRKAHLSYQVESSDAASMRNWGSPPPANMARGADIPVQRKFIDPHIHPYKFLDTHDRINSTDIPFWDPGRSQAIRSHESRHTKFNIITGEVAKKYDEVK